MAIKINLNTGETFFIEPGTSLQEISQKVEGHVCPIVAAEVNNVLRDLNYKIYESANIKFLDISDELGNRIYANSLSFIFIRAVFEIIPNCQVMVEHSLSKGLYCEIKGEKLTLPLVKKIEQKMHEIVGANELIIKERITKEKAIEIFNKQGQYDKVKILKYLPKIEGNIYKSGDFYDFFYGYLVPSTGYIKKFALEYYLPGVILRFPTPSFPTEIPEYVPQPKLAKVFYEAEKWAEILGVNTVADLNEIIENDNISMLIKVAEALHEKKVANIADEIKNHKDRGNIILIAGPSSSGKTTFAERLKVQLMVNGLKPITLSFDDYFVDREKTPLDENGEYDFESIYAIDIELINEHLSRLIQGEEVEIPSFNFITGKREYLGKKLKIRPDQPIIMEGIHGLNEKLTYSIPKDHKYKIYISCLTQLNIDNHNRIPTTDARKIRRIVRDHKYRGTKAIDTIRLWSSVRRGEERNIFPFQEDADIMFNSALIYELAVLKPYAKPLLEEITPDNPEFIEAQRLLRFLSYFIEIDAKEVPSNSIIREFI